MELNRTAHPYLTGHPRAMAGNMCAVHITHNPVPLRTVRHHIHPQEYGGQTTGANLLAVCDTGHYNIHNGIDLALDGKKPHNRHPVEKTMIQMGVVSIKNLLREFLLVEEKDANLEDWKTANDRRVSAAYTKAFPDREVK